MLGIVIVVLLLRDRKAWSLPLKEFVQRLLLQVGFWCVMLFLWNVGMPEQHVCEFVEARLVRQWVHGVNGH